MAYLTQQKVGKSAHFLWTPPIAKRGTSTDNTKSCLFKDSFFIWR